MSDNVVSILPKPAEGPMPEGTVFITIAQQNWPVPKLAVRQWRIVVPAVFKLMKQIGPMLTDATDEDSKATVASQMSFTTDQMDDLVLIVHAALTRAHPRITKDNLLDMEASVNELMAALPVIMRQAGLFSEGPAPTRTALASGEAVTGSPIGTV